MEKSSEVQASIQRIRDSVKPFECLMSARASIEIDQSLQAVEQHIQQLEKRVSDLESHIERDFQRRLEP